MLERLRHLIAWWLIPKSEMVEMIGDYDPEGTWQPTCQYLEGLAQVYSPLVEGVEWCEYEATTVINGMDYCGHHALILDPLSAEDA